MKEKNKYSLVQWVFMALCCGMGMFSKGIILPISDVVTTVVGTPGGIATSFSLMFLVIGARLCSVPFAATLMGVVQGFLAIALGMTGSMGALAPIGYILPGVVIDICYLIIKKLNITSFKLVPIINGLAAVTAAVFKNSVTYRISGSILALYLFVALTSGIAFGILGMILLKILKPVIKFE